MAPGGSVLAAGEDMLTIGGDMFLKYLRSLQDEGLLRSQETNNYQMLLWLQIKGKIPAGGQLWLKLSTTKIPLEENTVSLSCQLS